MHSGAGFGCGCRRRSTTTWTMWIGWRAPCARAWGPARARRESGTIRPGMAEGSLVQSPGDARHHEDELRRLDGLRDVEVVSGGERFHAVREACVAGERDRGHVAAPLLAERADAPDQA